MKKLLAMVLALVMTLSLAVSANAAFKDADKVSADYSEAVAVLNGMGVFKGYEDGSFQPQGNITRAEVATIIYRIYTQDLAKNDKSGLYASYNKFSDMTGAGWAAGYIGYCANAEFVKGYPDGTFKPSGNVTGYEVLTMILRAIGYDKNNEFTGADWAVNVAKYAEQAGVLENVKGVSLSAPATRELVAELLFRAIAKAPMVTYTAAFGYQTVSFNGKADGKTFKDNETLGHKNFDLTGKPTNGTYGRPATKWTYNCGDKSTTVYDKPVATYTEEFKPCDLCKDLSKKKEAKVTVAYVDGVDTSAAAKAYVDTFKASDTKTALGAQGQLVEVYENEKGEDYTVIVINTYLAKVTKVIEEVKDKNDHVKVEASVNVDVYGTKVNKDGAVTAEAVTGNFETTGFAKNDYVLVTYNKGDIASMEAAKSEGAKLTGLKGNKLGADKASQNVQDVTAVAYADAKVAVMATLAPLTGSEIKLGSNYTFYYDTYGNVIGVGDYNADADYVVIDRMWNTHDNGNGVVYANLVKVSDASVISKVVVDVVYKANGKEDNYRVSGIAADNGHFYEDLMTYTVNKDGEYELTNTGTKVQDRSDKDVLCKYDASTNKYRITVVKDSSNKYGDVYMDKDTEILFQYTETPDATYKAYTLDTLPNSFWGYVEWVEGTDGKADVVYVRGVEQTYSWVFIADPSVTSTKENDDKSLTMTLADAYYLTENGELGTKGLTVTSDSSDIVITDSQIGGTNLKTTELTKAGLYKLYTLGTNDQLLEYVPAVKLEAQKNYNDNDVVGFYNGGKFISIDDAKNFAWIGDFAGVENGAPYSKELTDLNKSEDLADINAGDWVYVQLDNDDDEIVALHKINLKVSVDFDADSKTLDKDAKITAPDMYYGAAAKDFTVDVSKWVKVKEVNNGYTFETKKEHSEARTYAVTAATTGADKLVNGDIVVKLAPEPAHDNKVIIKVTPKPADITNFDVEVTAHTNSGRGTIKVIATSAATVKVNDLLKCIKADGTHVNPDLVVFDNSLENKITDTNVTLDTAGNVAIAVYAEDGSVAYYNVVIEAPAQGGN